MTTRGVPDASRPVGEGADKCRAMTTTEHVGLADKLIETARALRLRAEAGIPDAEIVALQISEFARVGR